MNIHTRPIVPADEELLRQCHRTARYGELDQLGWSDEQKDLFLLTLYERQHQIYSMHYNWDDFAIICVDNQDAGCLLLAENEQQIELVDFALLSDFQKQGIAKTVIGQLQDRATAANKPIVMVLARSNWGYEFYLKMGFVELKPTSGDAWKLSWQAS